MTRRLLSVRFPDSIRRDSRRPRASSPYDTSTNAYSPGTVITDVQLCPGPGMLDLYNDTEYLVVTAFHHENGRGTEFRPARVVTRRAVRSALQEKPAPKRGFQGGDFRIRPQYARDSNLHRYTGKADCFGLEKAQRSARPLHCPHRHPICFSRPTR